MSLPRVAVIGAGKLGGYHANLASQAEDLDLVAIADPVAAAAEALAEKTGAHATDDYRSLIGKIDAAVVATPTVTHAPIVCDLLNAGVHVLVEKPIAPTRAEADRMVEAAREAGVVLQVGHVERFNPALEALPAPIAAPRYIQASRTSGYTFRSTDIGVVLDLMIHDIDLVLSMVDSEVIEVQATGGCVLGSAERGDHEDVAEARLRFANGAIAHLTASRVSYQLQRQMDVFGADGFASLDFATGKATVVRPTDEVLSRAFDPAAQSPERKQELFQGKLFEEVLVKSEYEAPAVNAIALELEDFAQAVRAGGVPRVTGQAARDAVAVAEQIIAQVATSQALPMFGKAA